MKLEELQDCLADMFSTGMSPHKYILARKLEKTKDMLDTTRDPIIYIAGSLGFCDASHFEKRFKDSFGMTPLEYRNKKQRF